MLNAGDEKMGWGMESIIYVTVGPLIGGILAGLYAKMSEAPLNS